MEELASKAGLDLASIPELPERKYKIDLKEMTAPIMKTSYCGIPVLALKCKAIRHKKKERSVLMIMCTSGRNVYFPGIDDYLEVLVDNEYFLHAVNWNHDESPQHTGGHIDVCENCFLRNGYWKIIELVKIIKGTSPYVSLMK